MVALGQFGSRRWVDTFIQQQVPGSHGVIVEARNQVARLETWCFNRLFRIHSELNDIQQNLQQRLILIVAAGSGERQDGLAVGQAGHDCRAESDSGALASG